jgi:hypothetical protein
MDTILKYPRTRHIEGSGRQKSRPDSHTVPFAEIRGRHLVIEEKLDGANVGLSFTTPQELHLQCRGTYLTGGAGEEQFGLLKRWTQCHQGWLWEVLRDRYWLYGEWLFAKHTVFYDALPHYFMEFDIYDRETEIFLSTEQRHAMLMGRPIVSVPVLRTGTVAQLTEITEWVRPSLYKTAAWRESLRKAAEFIGSDPETVLQRETDDSDFSEGLYIKWEENGRVVERYKWIRAEFIRAILESGTHWKNRPLIRNGLCAAADLYA